MVTLPVRQPCIATVSSQMTSVFQKLRLAKFCGHNQLLFHLKKKTSLEKKMDITVKSRLFPTIQAATDEPHISWNVYFHRAMIKER